LYQFKTFQNKSGHLFKINVQIFLSFSDKIAIKQYFAKITLMLSSIQKKKEKKSQKAFTLQ